MAMPLATRQNCACRWRAFLVQHDAFPSRSCTCYKCVRRSRDRLGASFQLSVAHEVVEWIDTGGFHVRIPLKIKIAVELRMRRGALSPAFSKVMDERILLAFAHLRMLRQIPSTVEQWMRIVAGSSADGEEMRQRMHVLRNF